MGIKYQQKKEVKVHPMKDGRRVPLKQLMKKLDLFKYEKHTPFINNYPNPNEVKILLKQHVGSQAIPKVKLRDFVSKGDLIASVEEGKLGAKIHASISGQVTHISENFIKISS